jgi:hypothetical protein
VSLMNRASAPSPGPATAPGPSVPGVDSAVERAVAFAGPYLEGLVTRAVPTPSVLRALSEELSRARSGGKNVAHPELLDADVYWAKSAWPQAAAVVKHARRALVELADELEGTVRGSEAVLDQWLTGHVAESAEARADDPVAARDAAIDEIAVRCTGMHRSVERLLSIRPPRTAVDTARAEVEQTRTRAGEDAARHQDLLVRAFELAHDAIDRDVCAMIDELTAPILGIGERIVRRYDEVTGDAAALDR